MSKITWSGPLLALRLRGVPASIIWATFLAVLLHYVTDLTLSSPLAPQTAQFRIWPFLPVLATSILPSAIQAQCASSELIACRRLWHIRSCVAMVNICIFLLAQVIATIGSSHVLTSAITITLLGCAIALISAMALPAEQAWWPLVMYCIVCFLFGSQGPATTSWWASPLMRYQAAGPAGFYVALLFAISSVSAYSMIGTYSDRRQ